MSPTNNGRYKDEPNIVFMQRL